MWADNNLMSLTNQQRGRRGRLWRRQDFAPPPCGGRRFRGRLRSERPRQKRGSCCCQRRIPTSGKNKMEDSTATPNVLEFITTCSINIKHLRSIKWYIYTVWTDFNIQLFLMYYFMVFLLVFCITMSHQRKK